MLFWRLRGRSGAALGASPGATWQFYVRGGATAVRSAGGTTLDFNGDGYADPAVGAFVAAASAGRVHVFFGSASGLSTGTLVELPGPDGGRRNFGSQVSGVGDFNGDGFSDLAVGAPAQPEDTGRAHVYLGSATGLAVAGRVDLTFPDGVGAFFASSLCALGDLDGDGFGELAVAAPQRNRLLLHAGSRTGISAGAARTLTGPDGGEFGMGVGGAR